MPFDDTPWAREKCAYKALQYLASDIPPFVDDVGISARAAAGSGYVVQNDAQSLEALHTLAGESASLMRLGGEGRHQVEQNYSLERWIPRLRAFCKEPTTLREDMRVVGRLQDRDQRK
jgi:hypothetical protein